ncbi:MAG: DNA polymerase I, partial [Bacteroidota bacterium]
MEERLYLLDAMALAYRAHFAFINRPLITSAGLDTSAVYGFTLALIDLLKDDPEHIAVVFEGEGQTYRDKLYEEYKANRPPMPEGIQNGLPYIKDIVEAFDIPVVSCANAEADDCIGTLTRRAEEEDVHVIIVSPDKDFRQLLSPNVSIMRPSYKGESFEVMTDETFREKYGGLEPEQFIDMLALMGDSADNVPGVPGIGEKTAMKLLKQYDSVENLLEHAGEVTGKRAKEGLANHREDALMSKKLVTIMTDLELDVEWHTLRRTDPHLNRLQELFRELEFRSMSRRVTELLEGTGKADEPEFEDPSISFDFGPYEAVGFYDPDKVDYTIIRNREQLDAFAQELRQHDAFAFDTETTSTDPTLAGLVGMSFSWAEHTATYVPVPLPDGTRQEVILDAVRPALEDAQTKKIGQHLKYDEVVMRRHGVLLGGPVFDTMIAHYLSAPEAEHNLDAIAQKHLNYRPIPISSLLGEGRSKKTMRDVPIEEAGPYACEDADITLRLVEPLRAKVEEDGLLEIAEQIEFPLSRILGGMEAIGVSVDTGVLSKIGEQLTAEIDRIEKEAYEIAGLPFNIGSPKQVGEVLFERLGMEPISKTSTGKPSTNERVLSQLSTEHELPGLILDWRHLSKLKGTYVDALAGLVHPETGRIHTNFNQTVTATGRLSSSNPNLQNIPVRSGIGREIRTAFVPAEGYTLLAADYVQIELRILAHMSGDPGLVEAFSNNEDIHTAAAARIFGISPEEVTRDQRRKAKEVNYGIPYGISVYELSQRLRVTYDEAKELMDQYHQSYP